MSGTIVLIPAAGRSVRYQKAGFSTPKQSLVIRHKRVIKSMLAHVENTVREFDVFIGMQAHSFIPGDIRGQVIEIENSRGQAHTVLQMLEHVPAGKAVIVLDCDMLLEEKDILQLDRLLCSWEVVIAVTKTFDPNASRIDSYPYPTLVREKEPISEYGIVGARGFRNKSQLTSALYQHLGNSEEEPYLSEAINYYRGSKIAYEITEFFDWGTPERLQQSGAEIL